MQHHLSDVVALLNRLHKLYGHAMKFCKPHRTSRIRMCYENVLAIVDIHTIHPGNYKTLLAQDAALDRATEMRLRAVDENDYEKAAYYRDVEKARLRYLLSQNSIQAYDRYFLRDGLIYEKI